MRKKLLTMCAALLLGLVAAMWLPGGEAQARYPRPGCGECRDGTLDMSTFSCPNAASDCTECTVCG